MLKICLAGTAALGLAFAPIAAQANTRAPSSAVSLADSSLSRAVSPTLGEEEDIGAKIPFGILVAIFGIVTAIAVATLITDNGGEVIGGPPTSPGSGN